MGWLILRFILSAVVALLSWSFGMAMADMAPGGSGPKNATGFAIIAFVTAFAVLSALGSVEKWIVEHLIVAIRR